MISALCRTTALSVTVLPMVLEVTRLFGGLFLSPSRLPKYFSWLDALSYIKYTFVAASLNELSGLNVNCTARNSTTEVCLTGSIAINDRGYDYINIGICVAVLCGFIIACRVTAFLGVRFLKH
jgi:ATP-binding cassette, subfamily G (WHITE), member 2